MALESPELERVRRAARRKTSADLEYRSALAAARAAGSSYATIAAAAATSRQRVRQLVAVIDGQN